MAAWALIFTSFMTLDTVIGKDKKTGMPYFDKYEEWFGRQIAGLTKTGKDIAKVPLGTALSKAQDANKLYRFGKILALDVYATSAAIIVWNAVSRMSAKKRHEKSLGADEGAAMEATPGIPLVSPGATPEEPKTALPVKSPRIDPAHYRHPDSLHSAHIAAQRHASDHDAAGAVLSI
jgi:hypothetical protein